MITFPTRGDPGARVALLGVVWAQAPTECLRDLTLAGVKDITYPPHSMGSPPTPFGRTGTLQFGQSTAWIPEWAFLCWNYGPRPPGLAARTDILMLARMLRWVLGDPPIERANDFITLRAIDLGSPEEVRFHQMETVVRLGGFEGLDIFLRPGARP
jgi:hypothetical protein